MIARLLVALGALLLALAPARADGWLGDWSSTFGQLRLVQDGDRVFGDYADIGTIEGTVGPDGRTLRGTFVYATDGRWGTFEWVRSGDRFDGTWRWSGGVTKPGDGAWTGTRTSPRASPLRYADPGAIGHPLGRVDFQEGPYTAFLDFRDARQIRPTPTPSPTPDPRRELGVWYAGFDLDLLDGAFEIGADIIHMRRDDTGSVDLSIYARPGAACPDIMHVEFCGELRAAADGRGFVEARVTGARRIQDPNGPADDFLVAFRLSGDRADRLMRIGLEATYYSAAIYHPDRGLDLAGFATRRDHLCETVACADDVFAALQRDTRPYLGSLGSLGWADAIRRGPDRIGESHGGNAAPTRAPALPAQGRPLLSDPWTVFEETNEPLGTVGFRPGPGGLAASGTFTGFFETGEPHETDFRLVQQTDQAVAFDLTIYSGQSGERREGRLVVELPSAAPGDPRGTLVVGDEIFLVYLAQTGNERSVAPPVSRPDAPNLDLIDPDEPVPEYPVIGIYKYDYILRDVPPGRELALRYEPSRDSGQIGQIGSRARPFQLHTCAPEIDSFRFEQATDRGRLDLLSAGWCEVLLPDGRGWVPGRYLRPVEPRQ